MGIVIASLGSFLVAGVIGFAAAGGLFLLRRHAWGVARFLGILALAGLGVGAAGLFVTLLQAKGDAAMNGMVLMVVGLCAVSVGVAVAFVIGAVQARALGRPPLGGVLSGTLDSIALGICLYSVTTFAHRFIERPAIDQSWQQELERRREREREKQAIPMPYREMGPEFLRALDEDRRMKRKMGVSEVETIPRDVENKLRNYWNATAMPPAAPNFPPERPAHYVLSANVRKLGTIGLGVGWVGGAIALPILMRRRREK